MDSAGESLPDVARLLSRFGLVGANGAPARAENGLVHDTFISSLENGERVVLQRINRHVFPDIDALMENVSRVCAHFAGHEQRSPDLIYATDGRSYHCDEHGDAWRVFRHIEDTVTIEASDTPEQVREAAFAFGEFATAVSDLPPPRLHVTIPGFHDTRRRLDDFVAAVDSDPQGRADSVREAIEEALSHGDLVSAIPVAHLPERIAHNDAKIGNVLFDAESEKAVCVIDFDTVMPGTVLHDFGDLVRSGVATVSENEPDLGLVEVSMPLFRAITDGYLAGCDGWLTSQEVRLLPVAGIVIAYEQALRFLTDHLRGDPYYKTEHEAQNLDRARNQLRLVDRLERHRAEMEDIVGAVLDSA